MKRAPKLGWESIEPRYFVLQVTEPPSNFDSTIPSANAWKSSTIVREVDSLIAMCTVAHKSWSGISVLILPAVWTGSFSLGPVPAIVKVVSFITNPQGLLIHLSHTAKASL